MSKGPYKYSEISGSKCLPKNRPNMSGKGKMSSFHGLNSGDATKGMLHGEGRLGSGTRSFKSNLSSTTGGEKGGPKHASQPKGHK